MSKWTRVPPIVQFKPHSFNFFRIIMVSCNFVPEVSATWSLISVSATKARMSHRDGVDMSPTYSC